MNIIASTEDLFNVSVVLLQSTLETTPPFTDVSRLRDFMLDTSLSFRSTIVVVQCLSTLWMASILPSFDILLQSILIGILYSLALLNILY